MRQFRGQRINTKEWVYGWYVEMTGSSYIKQVDTEWFVEVIPATVGQSIGLKNKNGVEIFCGDVVNWTLNELCNGGEDIRYQAEGPCEVFWCEEMACFGMREKLLLGHWDFSNEDMELEVIGNIHDNPELIYGRK